MTTESCGCTDTIDCGLTATPFEALRVAYGMLLREDDFTVLMGNPRGKMMLHNGWLHRSGVVWGFDVRVEGTKQLGVSRGLAVDGRGRELARTSDVPGIDLGAWTRANVPALAATSAETVDPPSATGCDTDRTIHACLYASFACCPSAPVQTLADPCDIERRHDTYSRVVESTRLELVRTPDDDCCSSPDLPYHRVRVLLGLDTVRGDDDEAGRKALKARRKVARMPIEQRTAGLLAAFRRLAARDVADIRPPELPGGSGGLPGLDDYPCPDDESARVPLACVTITVNDADDCPTVKDAVADMSCRTALLPTAVIQELTCAPAPALIDSHGPDPEAGPRVYTGRIEWSADLRTLTIPVTAPLNRGSVRGSAVRISSLSQNSWVTEDLDSVRYNPSFTTKGAAGAIVVQLADRPVNSLVRLVIKGTGPEPVYGVDPAAPLAGAMDGPPAGRHDGNDVVFTWSDLSVRPTTSRSDAEVQ